ncbi:unnamed protein product [Schistocephalus solidus]|uniref:Ubiquitin domain-containing protein UBFD1 n=1 Tax=Schistocephalus solidus TaxID=70667 RepID=A0A0X3PZY0_SCHSO|nr:unnamed protein product [Schistocephalus solidus]
MAEIENQENLPEAGGSTVKASSSDECISLTVVHNRHRYDLTLPINSTVLSMKERLESLTNVPADMQKLVFHGILDDSKRLSELKLPPRDAKLMLIGSERSAAEKVRNAEQKAQPVEAASESANEDSDSDLFSEGEHRRVLERFGMPEDAMVGIINSQDLLAPDETLSGMYDKRGQSLRLRFKPETSELWLATNSVTHKVPLATIHDVRSQPIKEHPEYHIMAFQLGPTKKSRFFVYWLPAQYVECIKTMVMQHRLLHGDRRTSF